MTIYRPVIHANQFYNIQAFALTTLMYNNVVTGNWELSITTAKLMCVSKAYDLQLLHSGYHQNPYDTLQAQSIYLLWLHFLLHFLQHLLIYLLPEKFMKHL